MSCEWLTQSVPLAIFDITTYCEQHIAFEFPKLLGMKMKIRHSNALILKDKESATSLKADWITTDSCPLWHAFLYMHVFSLQNVLKVKGSRSHLLENSIATSCLCSFSYLSVAHTCCCWFIWKVFDVYCVLRTHCLLLRLLSLLLLLNDKRSFRLP